MLFVYYTLPKFKDPKRLVQIILLSFFDTYDRLSEEGKQIWIKLIGKIFTTNFLLNSLDLESIILYYSYTSSYGIELPLNLWKNFVKKILSQKMFTDILLRSSPSDVLKTIKISVES